MRKEFHIGPALPIDAVLDPLCAALTRGHAVLAAPPGSGKTTKVPLALLGQPWLDGQRVLMLEPRRPAARLAAARMAAMLGESVGETVGYQVRFERRIGPQTRLEVLTEGLLTRRLQGDPSLEGVGLVIFDEFHERSLQADLGLALTLDAAGALRPDLRILIMSATLEHEAVARVLGEAAVVQAHGREHPVQLRYLERAPAGDPVDTAVRASQRAFAEQTGDLLVFLPGVGEIHRARERLASSLGEVAHVLTLHGDLPTREQDLALRPAAGSGRRVVLSTDIAETSLTIEGVSVVVDSGLARKPRFDPVSGLSRLVTEAISRASAQQRAGRAGRLGPGVCYRLWSPEQERSRPAYRTPEILQADLAGLALELAQWGVKDPTALAWLDPPPAAPWQQAVELLRWLGALDSAGNITPEGRNMGKLPVHPRLGHMLVKAPRDGSRRLAADLAALLSDRDPWAADRTLPRPADLGLRLRALERWRRRQPTPGMEGRRLARADRLSRQLAPTRAEDAKPPSLGAGALLAQAYPDRIAKRRPAGDGRYLLSGGRGVALPADDDLVTQEYLAVALVTGERQEGRIRLALPLAETELRSALAERFETCDQLGWDEQRQAVVATRQTRLGALLLRSRRQPLPDPQQAPEILLGEVGRRWERALTWTRKGRQFQARVALMRRLEAETGWPDLSDDWLRTHLAQWLGPWVRGMWRLDQVQGLDLLAILQSTLGWPLRQRLDELAPEMLQTPAGRRHYLDYGAGDAPVLAVKLQEMFGASETPRICGGRVPVLLHLLSPARRPVQVTADLASFWKGSYAEVRKQLRGRYPKHPWPEQPSQAQPCAGTRKRPRRT